jgi:hypothetical protein
MVDRKTEGSVKTFLGVTNGEWIGLAGMVVMFVASYAVLADNVGDNAELSKKNEAAIEVMREEVTQKIQESEERTALDIRESEQRTRGDIRELRQIMLQNGNRHQ